MTTRLRRSSLQPWLWAIGVLTAVALLMALDFPASHYDDLFYTGAAQQWAENGALMNPFLRDWLSAHGIRNDRFYVYPPLYSILLGLWIKVFGSAPASLALFQYASYGFALASLGVLLKALHIPQRAMWGFGTAMLATVGNSGLRPDIAGLAFLTAGCAALTRPSSLSAFAGALCLFAGVMTSPHTVLYAAPLGAVLAFKPLTVGCENQRTAAQTFIAILLAACVALFALLSMIGYAIRDFAAAFAVHAAAVAPKGPWSPGHVFAHVWGNKQVILTSLPTFALFLITCAASIRHIGSYRLGTVAAALLVSIFLDLGLPPYYHYPGMLQFFMWSYCIVAVYEWKMPRWAKALGGISIALSILLAQIFPLITLPAQMATARQDYGKIREFVKRHADKKYYVDSYAARYLFGYRLPSNATSWEFSPASRTFPEGRSFPESAQEVVWIATRFRLATVYHEWNLPWPGRGLLFGRSWGVPDLTIELLQERDRHNLNL